MRSRILVGALLVLAVFTVGGFASSGPRTLHQQWAIMNFTDPVVVLRDHILMGPYLIVHDDTKMARGEPCTSSYRFDVARGTRDLEVSFMCKPTQRAICEKTTFSVRRDDLGLNHVTEYQFAGDSEVHGVPQR
jgi:hypothetical protein